MVIRLGVTGLKNTKIVYLLDLFEGRGEKRSVQFSVYGVPLDDWADGGLC